MKKGRTDEHTHLFFALFLLNRNLILEIRIECYDGWLPVHIREPSRLAQAPLPAFVNKAFIR